MGNHQESEFSGGSLMTFKPLQNNQFEWVVNARKQFMIQTKNLLELN